MADAHGHSSLYRAIIIKGEVQIEEVMYQGGEGLEAICHMNCQAWGHKNYGDYREPQRERVVK